MYPSIFTGVTGAVCLPFPLPRECCRSRPSSYHEGSYSASIICDFLFEETRKGSTKQWLSFFLNAVPWEISFLVSEQVSFPWWRFYCPLTNTQPSVYWALYLIYLLTFLSVPYLSIHVFESIYLSISRLVDQPIRLTLRSLSVDDMFLRI